MGSKPRLSLVGGLPERRAANDLVTAVCSQPAASSLDDRIVRSLNAIAARPDERWTVARLAKVAGLSRAAFARRFAAEVGAPPLRHLAALRMRRAAELLAGTDASLADIAARVGYANEFALSRAFHRLVGAPPAAYRRMVRAVPSSFAPRCLAA
jgi:transcriptional regulator GlxA family with amidase domain